MSENGVGRAEPLAGWVIVTMGARLLLGKLHRHRDPPTLEPVYDVAPMMEPTPKGLRYHFAVTPALGIISIRSLPLPPGVLVPIEELSPEERRDIAQAVLRIDDLLRRLRAGAAGLVVTSKMPEG